MNVVPIDVGIEFDPEADAAVLSFPFPPRSGGRSYELLNERGSLVGLIRTDSTGNLGHVEILGAARALQNYIRSLDAPAPGVRDYLRGTFDIPATTEADGSGLMLLFSSEADEGRAARAVDRDGAELARLGYAEDGSLATLTLYAVGPLLSGLSRWVDR